MAPNIRIPNFRTGMVVLLMMVVVVMVIVGRLDGMYFFTSKTGSEQKVSDKDYHLLVFTLTAG